jgi:hypothetical protein
MKKQDIFDNIDPHWRDDGGYNFVVKEEIEDVSGKISIFAWWDSQKWRFCFLKEGKQDPFLESEELE